MARFESYHMFDIVCRCGSFTEAARQLGTGQPAVSRAMAILEQELGCTLFLRSKQGVTLTPQGERLYDHIHRACEEIEKGERELFLKENVVVRLGISETALHSFLPGKLRRFREEYPQVKWLIHNVTTPKAEQELRQGTIDLAVVSSPNQVTPPITAHILCPYQETLIAGPAFRKRLRNVYRLRDLVDVPWISMERGSLTYQFYYEWFSKHGVPYEPDIEVATVDMILPMVENGFGIGFVPAGLSHGALQEGKVWEIAVRERMPRRGISLLLHADKELSLAALALCRHLQKQEGV